METELRQSKNYNTDLYNYLCTLPEAEIYGALHVPPLKHPADILIDQLTNVKAGILNCRMAIIDKNIDSQISIKNVFHAVDTFFDNCYNIIKALNKPSNNKEEFTYRWLKLENIKTGEDFFQYTNTHHEFISKITNKIKHDNPKILSIQFKDNKSNSIIDGFYFGTIIKEIN